jgi:hypothetical protein
MFDPNGEAVGAGGKIHVKAVLQAILLATIFCWDAESVPNAVQQVGCCHRGLVPCVSCLGMVQKMQVIDSNVGSVAAALASWLFCKQAK